MAVIVILSCARFRRPGSTLSDKGHTADHIKRSFSTAAHRDFIPAGSDRGQPGLHAGPPEKLLQKIAVDQNGLSNCRHFIADGYSLTGAQPEVDSRVELNRPPPPSTNDGSPLREVTPNYWG